MGIMTSHLGNKNEVEEVHRELKSDVGDGMTAHSG